MSGLDGYGAAEMFYLLGFLVIIVLAFIPRMKSIGFGKTAKMALSWIVIFGALILLVGEWPRIRAALDPASPVVDGDALRLRPRADGHYYVRGAVNGVPTVFLIDTGASDVVLTLATAEAAGFPASALNFDGAASTANGMVRIAGATLDTMQVGPIEVRRQRVAVNQGALDANLLGMAFLNELSGWRVENGELILQP